MQALKNEDRGSRALRTAGFIAAAILLFFVIVWGRALYGSWENYRQAEAFLEEGHTVRAITFFDRSIHWYTPFNPYVRKSAERLWEIGEKARKDGDERLALIAFETIRSGFYGASHVIVPGKDWISRVDAKLVELGVRGSAPPVKDPHPDIFWSVVVVMAFLGWVGSLFAFIGFALRRKERPDLRPRRAVLWIGTALICFVLWIVGMWKA